MIYVFDTDHFSALDRSDKASEKLRVKTEEHRGHLFTTIITYEQVVRGWLARIRQCKTAAEEIIFYGCLQRTAVEFADWDMLPWDEDTVHVFEALKKQVRHVGTMDLKVASIALAYDATVLTRNTVDFAKVPGLRFENWLD